MLQLLNVSKLLQEVMEIESSMLQTFGVKLRRLSLTARNLGACACYLAFRVDILRVPEEPKPATTKKVVARLMRWWVSDVMR